MPIQEELKSWNRREFLVAMSLAAAAGVAPAESLAPAGAKKRDVYIVPNFHPASCGWLTTFSKERIYCANSYLSHLDRVRDDENYAFVLSEINNIIAILNFRPERMPELKQRVTEGRVELVNSFFLESTVNLSGGEALVRLGVLGQRWYQRMFGVAPRHAWNIDTCGVHDQMPQIAAGLGLDAMVYTRRNPTGKTLYWSVSPDGSKILTLCPGSYTDASSIFSTKEPLNAQQMEALNAFFAEKETITPGDAPVMVLGGSEDYSIAPTVKQYPSLFLQDWSKVEPDRRIRFSTLSEYLQAVRPRIDSGSIAIPTFVGGTAYDFDAFWIENQTVKTEFRAKEHALQAAEALATVASLTTEYAYPAQRLYDAWILMCLNMDRNTLWGSAGGMVFVDSDSWDVQDRFAWAGDASRNVLQGAASSMSSAGASVALFNQLNWKRSAPVALQLGAGISLEGVACEALPDGSVLCEVEAEPMSIASRRLVHAPAAAAVLMEETDTVETRYYTARFDRATGCLASLRQKSSDRELIAGLANRIVAERPKKMPDDPADHMPPIPERERLGTSSDAPSTIQIRKGPVATTVEVRGTFYGGGAMRRSIRFYANHPRIDFETELQDVPNYTVAFAEFPLAEDITEVRRGIPYGFSHGAWSVPNARLHGWTKGIVPAVRWIDFTLRGGGGVALLDRGLSGRELNGNTPALYLLNAEDKYWGYDNAWLTGKGRHILPYALLPHEAGWEDAGVPQAAWEYNAPLVLVAERAETPARSYLQTTNNVIVEAMRREGDHIELRLVECLGKAGHAEVALALPHTKLTFTTLTGEAISTVKKDARYSFQVRPQQIVTLHFHTDSTVPEPEIVTRWDKFVPKEKLPALHAYDPRLIGHPPFGR